jgi:hypothetical protein
MNFSQISNFKLFINDNNRINNNFHQSRILQFYNRNFITYFVYVCVILTILEHIKKLHGLIFYTTTVIKMHNTAIIFSNNILKVEL